MCDLRPHWWFFVHDLAWGGVLLLAAGLLAASGLLAGPTAGVAVSVVAVLAAARALTAYLAWSHTRFVVTTRKVAYRTGVLTRHGVEIPLPQLTNIVFHQSLVERLLGAGTLELESAGADGESRFSHVRDPEGLQRVLHGLLEPPPGGPGPGVSPGAAPGVLSEAAARSLRELAALHRSGHLDGAEFAAAKRRILFGG